MAFDPICKMTVNEKTVEFTSECKGKKYCFCALTAKRNLMATRQSTREVSGDLIQGNSRTETLPGLFLLFPQRVKSDHRIQSAHADGPRDQRDQPDKRNEIRPRLYDHVQCKYPDEYNPEYDPDHTVDHANIFFSELQRFHLKLLGWRGGIKR
jgi:YHS domain-containing protein